MPVLTPRWLLGSPESGVRGWCLTVGPYSVEPRARSPIAPVEQRDQPRLWVGISPGVEGTLGLGAMTPPALCLPGPLNLDLQVPCIRGYFFK